MIGNFRFRYRFRPKFWFRYAFRFRYHSIFRFRPKFRFKIEPKTEIWTYPYHWFSANFFFFLILRKYYFSNIFLSWVVRNQTYDLLFVITFFSMYKTVSCLTNKMRQDILLKCSLSFGFGFRFRCRYALSFGFGFGFGSD